MPSTRIKSYFNYCFSVLEFLDYFVAASVRQLYVVSKILKYNIYGKMWRSSQSCCHSKEKDSQDKEL